MIWTYVIIAAILLIAELVYFKIADHLNIIDKPNERSSHTTIVLRGGGVIFAISMLVWFGWQMFKFQVSGFIEPSYLVVAIIGVLVFSVFNFRPKGKAKCFAGDVGSIGIAFIILFALGRLMLATKDITYIVSFLVYGIDGSLTIFHRIMLHENLGQAHRKHAYQLMANELKMSHVTVSCIYMVLQLIISLGFIYLCPNTILAHWVYLIGAGVVLAIGYILFMRKYYYLHEQYLKSLEK